MKKHAFTLVELIVVITILAILGTISFISLQGYSKDARDVKRISDVRSLLTKLNVEQSLGTPPKELITNTTERQGQILGIPNIQFQTMGEVNFQNINEKQEDFQDPSNNKDYYFAYAKGGTGSRAYNFIQGATISEKENETRILGNYYTTKTNDIPSLFMSGSTYYEEGEIPIYNVNDENNTNEGSNNGGSTPPPPLENGVTEGTEQTGQLTDGTNFTWQDLTFSYNGTSYTLMDRNLGATSNNYTLATSYGSHYQWGRNDTGGFPASSSDSGYTWVEEDQGPCPAGYHVPSTLEWDSLVKLWYLYRNSTCTASAGNSCSLGSGETTLANFQSDLKIPLAGRRNRDNGSVNSQGSYGYYWSSSPIGTLARFLNFNSSHVYPQRNYPRAYGFSVRCFKN